MLKERTLTLIGFKNLKAGRNLIIIVLVMSLFVTPVLGKGKSRKKVANLTPEITKEIVDRSRYYGLDPCLVLEVMRQESSFDPNACSSAGARGLMQFIPSTAKRFGISNPHDVSQSVDAGCRYLAFLIRKFNGRLDLVLAGYNAGEGAVEKHGNAVPPYEETQNYVKTIIANYKRALVVKEAFLKKNNITLSYQSRPIAVNYKVSRSISNKVLSKKKLQEKLTQLEKFSSNSNRLIN